MKIVRPSRMVKSGWHEAGGISVGVRRRSTGDSFDGE